MVKATVTHKKETHEFTEYFITSLTDINEFAASIRKHWFVENQLHWCLDVIFREDASRSRKDIKQAAYFLWVRRPIFLAQH